jgi:hypothetical protein
MPPRRMPYKLELPLFQQMALPINKKAQDTRINQSCLFFRRWPCQSMPPGSEAEKIQPNRSDIDLVKIRFMYCVDTCPTQQAEEARGKNKLPMPRLLGLRKNLHYLLPGAHAPFTGAIRLTHCPGVKGLPAIALMANPSLLAIRFATKSTNQSRHQTHPPFFCLSIPLVVCRPLPLGHLIPIEKPSAKLVHSRRALSRTINKSHQETVSGQVCNPPDPH